VQHASGEGNLNTRTHTHIDIHMHTYTSFPQPEQRERNDTYTRTHRGTYSFALAGFSHSQERHFQANPPSLLSSCAPLSEKEEPTTVGIEL
jgi:hypothetical protein